MNLSELIHRELEAIMRAKHPHEIPPQSAVTALRSRPIPHTLYLGYDQFSSAMNNSINARYLRQEDVDVLKYGSVRVIEVNLKSHVYLTVFN